jgi:predicted RNA-binding Zn ribbon-like protein
MRSRPGEVRRGGREGPRGFVFELSAGRLCLDFANTLDERPTAHPRELLTDHGGLTAWGRQAAVLSREQALRAAQGAARRPAAAARALRRARALREMLFAVFSAVAHGRGVPPSALEALNAALPAALAPLRVAREGRRFVWAQSGAAPDLDAIGRAVARDAADLLTSGPLERVRECSGASCAWLFLDRSRNGTRRWCDMSVCGNRAKAQRHHRRTQAEAPRRAPRADAPRHAKRPRSREPGALRKS